MANSNLRRRYRMILYTIFMVVFAAFFLILGILLSKGKTGLVHDYHQTHVREKEKTECGKAFLKGMFSVAITCFSSGIAGFRGTGKTIETIATAVLFAGLAVSFIILGKVQNKNNGRIF